MILTITLNPSIDISVAVPQLIPNDKLRCERYEKEVGGGGINVAKGLHRLGIDAQALFFSGGHNGQFIESKLLAEQIIIHPLRHDPETRENITVVDQERQLEYRLVNKGNEIYPGEEQMVLDKMDELNIKPEFLVLSGSPPPGLSNDFVKKIAAWCLTHESKLVLDLPGDPLGEALKYRPYLIKPNLKEISQIAGRKKLNQAEALETAKSWIEKELAEIIVISMGDQGAIICDKNESYMLTPPKVKSLSTVGAGDSMVAGLLYQLHNRSNLKEVLMMGIACGTAATLSRGTKLFEKEQAFKLYDLIRGAA
jgi:6-phosphofructokinase 2